MADDSQDEVVFIPEERKAPPPTDIDKLEEIHAELENIAGLSADTGRWFVRGMLQGAGAIVGSIIMLAVLGWALSAIGLIPGAGEIAHYISGYLSQVHR
jgi:hypothetical protein